MSVIECSDTSKFLEVCRRTKYRCSWINDEEWKTCVSLMLQAGFANLEDAVKALKRAIVIYRNKFNSIYSLRLRPDVCWHYEPSTIEDRLGHLRELNGGIRPLQHLKHLMIGGPGANPDYILEMLASVDFCAEEKLTCLSLHSSPLNADNVETLFFRALPRFPNLETLCLESQTASNALAFRTLENNRIEYDGTMKRISNSLRKVIFRNAYAFDSHHKEVIAILLKHFVSINDIHYEGQPNLLLHDELAFPLLKNMVGRRVLGKEISLALWPTLLHRAQSKIDESSLMKELSDEVKQQMKASGIYYLLKEGPAVIGRRDLGSEWHCKAR